VTKESWKRDLEKDIWTAGLKYSWKMEATAQVVCGRCSTGSDSGTVFNGYRSLVRRVIGTKGHVAL